MPYRSICIRSDGIKIALNTFRWVFEIKGTDSMKIKILTLLLSIFLYAISCTQAPQLQRSSEIASNNNGSGVTISGVEMVFSQETFSSISGEKTVYVTYGNFAGKYDLESDATDDLVTILLENIPANLSQDFVVQVLNAEGDVIKMATLDDLKISSSNDDKVIIDECLWRDRIWTGEDNVNGCQWEIITN